MAKPGAHDAEQQPKPRRSPLRLVAAAFSVLVALLSAVIAFAARNPRMKAAIVDFFPEHLVFAAEAYTGWPLSVRGFKPEMTHREPEDWRPETPFQFTVHFNGDGSGAGVVVQTKDFQGLNALLRDTCTAMPEVQALVDEHVTLAELCDPDLGAKLFTHRGRRVFSFADVLPAQRTYVVPRGLHFSWPLGAVGEYFFPEAIESPVEGKPIRLRQLSLSPRVYTVENFMSQDELDAILEHNRDLLKPSEVGFAGWRDNTRTSSTAWDFHSWAARKVQRRSFDLLGMEFDSELADAVQVLRYNRTEWYKPHTDWFDEKAYDGHDPKLHNGTNRFATVFLYLTDVDAGGHTVFPLSTTHEGYNGEELVHPGTENTPGYIAHKDALWVCNTSSTALRSTPRAGNAVLFYSQLPDGTLDKYSLHGGCPVLSGIKYSANVWIWNRPKPDKGKAKDGKPSSNDKGIDMQFKNARDAPVKLFWDDGTDEGVFQVEVAPQHLTPMTTYHGHSFFAVDTGSGEKVFKFTAHDDMKDKDFVAEIM